MSLEKSRLTDYVGELATEKMRELDIALTVAVGLAKSARASIEPS
jgi:mRNA-degrading endonuclease toxin of MazEF toxin-antitoxin module